MKIQEICSSVTDGSHNPPQGVTESEYLMLSSKNVFDDNITFVDPRYLCKEDFDMEDRRTCIQAGDVLLTIVGTVGRCAVVPERAPKFTLQRSVAVLHPRVDICNSRFLMYALQGKRSYIEGRAKGVAQKGIYLGEVANIEVPIPEKSIQATIITHLDKIASIIHKRQQQLSALDDLIKARFVEMFEHGKYPQVEFGEICEYLRNGANIKQTKGAGGYPITRIETLANDVFNTDRLGYANIFELGKYENYLLKPGDILISHINSTAYLGRAVQYRGQMSSPIIHGMNLLCARIAKGYNPTYIEFFFKTPSAKEYISSITKKAVNQASITTSDLKKMMIPAPSLEKQNEFDQFVAQIDKSKSVIQKSLDETQLLFDSLMQKYFG